MVRSRTPKITLKSSIEKDLGLMVVFYYIYTSTIDILNKIKPVFKIPSYIYYFLVFFIFLLQILN